MEAAELISDPLKEVLSVDLVLAGVKNSVVRSGEQAFIIENEMEYKINGESHHNHMG